MIPTFRLRRVESRDRRFGEFRDFPKTHELHHG